MFIEPYGLMGCIDHRLGRPSQRGLKAVLVTVLAILSAMLAGRSRGSCQG